jgi:hypothetical protein
LENYLTFSTPAFFFSPLSLQQGHFNSTDQNQLPLGEPQKLPFPSLDHVDQPLLHRRQSLNDLAAVDDSKGVPLQQKEQPSWIYEETNIMLRDLHFERVHRLGRSEDQ